MDPKDLTPEELKRQLSKEREELQELKKKVIQIKKEKARQRKKRKREKKEKEREQKRRKEILKNLPPPPSSTQKILIRVLFSVILILGLGLFVFWGFQKRGKIKNWFLDLSFSLKETRPQVQQTSTKKQPPQKSPKKAPQPNKKSLSLPSPLIGVYETEVLEVSSASEIPGSLTQFFSQELSPGSWYQILIKNTSKEKWITLTEILKELGVKAPPEFYSSLESEFTLLLFSQPPRNQLALVAEIKPGQDLPSVMNSWEQTMGDDLGPLFSIMGLEGRGISSFKSAEYQGSEFRYVNFNLPKLGICYGIVDSYLALSTSGESMIELINHLKES